MRASTTADPILNSATSGQAAYSSLSPMHTSRRASLSNDSTHSENDNELLVAGWLEKLLKHFGLDVLDGSSEYQLLEMLERCGEDNSSAFQNRFLLLELKRKIIRTAGAKLDSVFVTMSPDVIDEEDAEAVALEVEGRKLQGLRYQGDIYRLTDAFLPCHRLQAFCLGQTLSEQRTTFIITQSPERFAVWVNVRAFPHRHHLPSASSLTALGG